MAQLTPAIIALLDALPDAALPELERYLEDLREFHEDTAAWVKRSKADTAETPVDVEEDTQRFTALRDDGIYKSSEP